MDGVLIVDKPAGPTSHDVVAWARKAFGTQAIGHAGTLDPMATGVLLLCIGQARKLAGYLTGGDKAYDAEVTLGSQTDTLDAQGHVVARAPIPELRESDVERVLGSFVGEIRQQVPAWSAVQVEGERLYAKARRGEEVEAPERTTVVHRIELLGPVRKILRLRVECGKGCYVRALGRDIAAGLGTVGHLSALRRTRCALFGVDRAVKGDDLRRASDDPATRDRLVRALIAPADAWCGPHLVLTEPGLADALHGRSVVEAGVTCAGMLNGLADGSTVALIGSDGQLVALGCRQGAGVRILRGVRTDESR